MAKSSIQLLISTLFLASIVFMNFPRATLSDEPCQYPCYPPPTSTGATPTTPSTPTPPSVVSYPPPTGVYPTPPSTGVYPYYNPPPNDRYYGAQPPPDPILPYFPFYYKEPLHRSPDDQSSSFSSRPSLGRLALLILLFIFLLYFPSFS
ncbi:hypothetical protein L484_017362 [Morus notabilis]|uniref:Uncharacterized protein n=1 Tax=Morus notabilis TaxID=981085 RepID=W9RGI7_9ROSA|nr:leucine-rich repeat extensin-like protein 5 [Morus notabilis]EXB89396.1 hypothetical protein L484_017362 [Morus notabilis]